MPLSKSLSKIQKNMKGKKITVHPKGRKFGQLARATLRDNKIQEKKRSHNEKRSNELARMVFIQNCINSEALKSRPIFTFEETVALVNDFIARDDDELEGLKSKRRSNRPPTSRQQLLQQKRDHEVEELKSGFLCPDLTDEKNVIFLRAWNGTFGALSTLKLVRINDKGERVVGGSKPTASATKDVDMS